LVTGDPFDNPINIGSNNMIVAIGNQPKLVKHIQRQFVIIDLVTGHVSIPLGIFEIHGILMGITWLLIFPMGFLFIRFFGNLKNGYSRKIHIGIQSVGMIIFATAVILGAMNVIVQFDSIHGMIGFLIVALCAFQVIS
jgi:hypothetical protein